MITPSTPLRVLVVDDEPLLCWSIAETLGEQGDTVMNAGSGTAAIATMSSATSPIDVVLLDDELPDVYDSSLLSAIRHFWPASRVIVMSADLTPEIAHEALSLGASRVIGKPVDMRDVPALVHDAV